MLQVYRLCINMLMTAYTAAILVGASSPNLYQKIATVSDILGFFLIQKYKVCLSIWLHGPTKLFRCLVMACSLLCFGREHDNLTSQIRHASRHFTCSFGRWVSFIFTVCSINSMKKSGTMLRCLCLMLCFFIGLQLFYAEYFLIPFI